MSSLPIQVLFKVVKVIFKKSDNEIIHDFHLLKTREDLANLLEINDKSLRYILYAAGTDNFYHTFSIPKKKGGRRQIHAPHGALKEIQRKLNYILQLIYSPRAPVYGFVKGRSIKRNAKIHMNKKWVLNIDLKDFFDTINFGRVRGILLKPPYNIGEGAATAIAQIACHNNCLPQGAPTSPVLSNMICKFLDTRLSQIAKEYGLIYSRYADDMTFSTTRPEFPPNIAALSEQYEVILGRKLTLSIEKCGFIINYDKVFLNHFSTRQEVTGLVVNKFPNIKREYLNNTRAMIHECKTKGVQKAAYHYFTEKGMSPNQIASFGNPENIESHFKNALCGRMRFIKYIKGDTSHYFLKYASLINEIFGEPIFNITQIKERILENMIQVFISYSHEEQAHQDWVLHFAERLRADGFEVITDQSHLQPGDRMPHFMEQAIRDNTYVLMICTPTYKKKSDNREGGVGYEEDIITAELLSKGNNRKFIPILRKGNWESSLPTCLGGKYGIDLRGKPYSIDEYHTLVRTLRCEPKA